MRSGGGRAHGARRGRPAGQTTSTAASGAPPYWVSGEFLGPDSLRQHEPGLIPTLAPAPGHPTVYQSVCRGGWISLQSCRQWVQGLVADKATAFWEPKLCNYSQGSPCHGLKALNTRITLGGGDTKSG